MTIDEFARSIENDMTEWIRTLHHVRTRKGMDTVSAGLVKARSLIIIRKLSAIRRISMSCDITKNQMEDYHGNDLTV